MALYPFSISYCTLTFRLQYIACPHTDSYTHYSASAPQSTKDSLIRSLSRRAYDICSPQHLQHELDHIRTGKITVIFSITVIHSHALPMSCTELSNRLIFQHPHPARPISILSKSLYRTTHTSTSRLAASCNGTQFLHHSHPTRIFVIFFPAHSLVSQHRKPAMSCIRSLAKTA